MRCPIRDQGGQAKGPEDTGKAQQPGVRTGRFVERTLVQDEGRLVQQGQAGGHPLHIDNLYVIGKQKPEPKHTSFTKSDN